jgi:hypothetical protein
MPPPGGYAGIIRNNRARVPIQHWRGLQRGGVWRKCDKAGNLVAQGAGVGGREHRSMGAQLFDGSFAVVLSFSLFKQYLQASISSLFKQKGPKNPMVRLTYFKYLSH